MKFQENHIVSLLLVILSGWLFVSCGDSGTVRKYKEKKSVPIPAQQAHSTTPGTQTPPPGSPGHGQMPAQAHFKWESPEGWEEAPKTSGMRLATFNIKSGEKTAVCTVVPLKGEAGGLNANVQRWMGQVGIQPGEGGKTLQAVLDAREKFLTKGQFAGILIDVTAVTQGDETPSVIATVLDVRGNSVFIKMTGPKNLLLENKDKFKALCSSFSSQSGPES